VSRPCVFAVFNLDELYLPHIDIELCVLLCWVAMFVTPGANEEWLSICFFLGYQNGVGAIRGESISSR